MNEIKLEWDGEKIKQHATQEERKYTPKEILNSLAHVRNQINQMETQKMQLEQQFKAANRNIKSAKEHEAKLKPFESKCNELQLEKLKLYLRQLHKECMEKAAKSAKETVEKDPNAYGSGAEKNIAYLDYQKNLATNPKIAENISAEIIKKYLYETPVFDNPFLTTSKD